MLLVFLPIYIWADEGMWLPCCLSKQTQQVMKDMGLNLTPRQLYNPGGAALSNAVVSFGGFCSGVVVSPDGLVFTNHHCGFDAIRQHSTVKHDTCVMVLWPIRYRTNFPIPIYLSVFLFVPKM